jgi:hypothetical protein
MTSTAAESSVVRGRLGAMADSRWRADSPRWLYVIWAAGILTFLPALLSPLVLDDYLHAAMVRGSFPAPRGIFDLYDFVSDVDRQLLIDRGVLPWWTHPAFTIRFFRPLSSALLWADHWAFHGHPLLLHVPPFLCWGLVVVGARRLFRPRLPPRVALLATAIFALGAWHAIPLGWLANSEALVSLGFGVFALDAHLRWREGQSALYGVLAGVLFAAALLAGEYALCLGGYVLAIEVVRKKEGLGRAILGMLPLAVPAAGYLLVRGALHYGAFGSGFYADPLRDPMSFLRLAPFRLTALLDDGWLTIPCDTWGFGDERWGAPVVLLLAAIPMGYLIRRTLRRLPDPLANTTRWMLLGSILAIAPVASVVPAARLLGASAIGLSAVVAILLEEAWFTARPELEAGEKERRREREILGAVGVLLGFAQLVHGPATAWLAARQMRSTAVDFVTHTEWLREKITDPGSADVMVVRAGGGMFFGPFAVDADGRPPARWRTLSHTGHAMVLRKGPRTLEVVTPPGLGVYPGGDGNLFRTPELPLEVGSEVLVPGMRAKIVAVGPNGPTRVRFDFDEDIDSAPFVWTAEDAVGFHSVELPKVGFGAPFDP